MKIFSVTLKLSVILLIASLPVVMLSCDDDENGPTDPVINSFTPASALPGASVTISGKNFSTTPASNQVAFNGTSASVASASATELVVTVPEAATTGKITVTVNGKLATSATDFAVLQTTITSFAPESGILGTTVTITGTNFSTMASENMVKFNGVAATVSAATATQLTVTVPAESTTGKITVTINGITKTSAADFTVPAPIIASYFPPIAAAGISVKVTGTNFSPVMTDNVVKFNGEDATVTAASPTELTVTVPAAATSGAISVKVGPHTATSSVDFAICTGSAELVISDVVISNTSGATSYNVSFKITNVGAVDADLAKMGMQNYASTDDALGGDVAASGFSLTAEILSPGESYNTPNFSANIVGGNTTSHPYLIITIYDFPEDAVPECNDENNVVIRAFD
jgi:hypothetical protein